jgi:citrate synthase
MGFGHRVYKVEDPRASVFLKAADDLSLAHGDRSMLDKVEALVEAMKPYRRFGISPNVDLYAAVIYRLLGIDGDQFTGLFAVSRIAGWLAQIREQRNGSNVLIRPRLRYVGLSVADENFPKKTSV